MSRFVFWSCLTRVIALVAGAATVGILPAAAADGGTPHPLEDRLRRDFAQVSERLESGSTLDAATEAFSGRVTRGFQVLSDLPPPVAPEGMLPVEQQAWLAFAQRRALSTEADLRIFLPGRYTEPFLAQTATQRVALRAVGAADSLAEKGQRGIVYQAPWPGVDSVHVAGDWGSEEFLLLSDDRAPRVFRYEVLEAGGVSDITLHGGQVRFGRAEGHGPELALTEPWLMDATGKVIEGAVRWQLLRSEELTTVLLVVTEEDLRFPVLVDPGFTTTGSMGSARVVHTATLLTSGKVLVAGGFGATGGTLASCELFDPGTGTWSATGSMMSARARHTATLLRNGKVLVTGGDGPGALAGSEVYDPATGTWVSTGLLSSGRYHHTATLLRNGGVLVTGGTGTSANLSSVEMYDPALGTWSTVASMSVPRASHAAALLPDGRLLVTGGGGASGATLATAELYEPLSATWSPTGSMTVARIWQSATLLANGTVLVAGGFGSSSTLTSAEVYQPATGSWSATGSMASARQSHTASLLPNGKVLVTGGYAVPQAIASVEVYDPSSGAWSTSTSMAHARVAHSASLLPGGRILVAGGGGSAGNLSAVELYDAGTVTSAVTGSMLSPRYFHRATLLTNNRVLVTGGFNGTAYTSSAEIYHPGSGLWAATASMNVPRGLHTATRLEDGRILVTGGTDGVGDSVASAELYDLQGGTWTPTGSMSSLRREHTATLLPNGKVLVAAGYGGAALLASAELYDPAAGTWSPTGGLVNPRSDHTATLLPNGRVLVAGGSGTTFAEVYDPLAGAWTMTGSMSLGRSLHSATLLPNGNVLVTGGSSFSASAELFDHLTGSWSMTAGPGMARTRHAAVLLQNGKVLVTGGGAGAAASTELFDPAAGTWTAGPALHASRQAHTATLLSDGQILVAGGVNVSSAELFDLGLGADPSTRPYINRITSLVPQGNALSIQGAYLTGISEASGGAFQGSATNYPLVQLRRLDNEETRFLPVSVDVGFDAMTYQSATGWTLNPGPALVTVFTNGIPGLARQVLVRPPCAPLTGGPITGATSVATGDGDHDGDAQPGYAYSNSPMADATYEWSVSPGAVIHSGQGTSSVSVWFEPGTGPFAISVTVTTPCGSVTNGPLQVTKASGSFYYEFTGAGPAPGWTSEVGSWGQVGDGTYGDVSTTTTGVIYESASYGSVYGDFTYEAALILGRTAEPGATNSLYVRGVPGPYAYSYKRWRSGIAFNVSGNGKYSIYRMTPTTNVALQTWTFPSGTTLVADGTTENVLKVEGTGGTLRFWINGVLVKTVTGQTQLSGKVGLGMVRYGPTTDYLKVGWARVETSEAPALRAQAAQSAEAPEPGILREDHAALGTQELQR